MCHGREVVVSRGTPHAPTPSLFRTSKPTSSTLAGSAAELSKNVKYADIIAGVDFVSFVIETSGVWGEQALVLVTEVGRRMAELSKSHALRRSYVSACRSLFSAETLRVFWELCAAVTARSRDRQ